MKNAVIYCRVSTNKQEKNWDSLENQERACREYCKNNSIQVIWVFKEAFTWKEQNRPVFNSAIAKAIEDQIEYFIIFDIDRFTREWYWIFKELKNNLELNWIKLKDSKNIIWDKTMVVSNDDVDMDQYKWNHENNSQYAEVMIATQAEIEGRKIMQRTITREIELEQAWYHVRPANYWYINKKVKTGIWKVTIQEHDTIEWPWVIEMFLNRSEWMLTDKEIVRQLNLKWCIKRSNKKPMDVKYMQELIKKPIYAWIIKTKWTWYKPIKAAYEWLVSIDLWNKANKWKIKIIEVNNNDISIVYKNKNDILENTIEVKEKRKDYNSDYPYAKVLSCPECDWTLTWNNAKSRSWAIHKYYQCTWKKGIKHKNYSLKQQEVNESIMSLFCWIDIDSDVLKLFEEISEEVYNNRKIELVNDKELYLERIKGLRSLANIKIQKVDKVIDFPILLQALNKELEDIKIQINDLEYKSNNIKDDMNIDSFKKYSINLIKHIDKIVQQRENPDMINLAFEIMFNTRIVFNKIDYQTTNNDWLLWIQSQKKNPHNGDLIGNSKWQAH